MDLGTLLVVIIPLIASIELLRRGLRGRRVGETPYCRHCNFNLTGRPADSTRCSECGTDLIPSGAIVYGQKQRSRVLIATGLLLLLLTSLPLARRTIPAIRDFDPTPYKPVWWLVHDLKGTSELVALNELIRRLEDNALSESQARQLADIALAHQANRLQKWEDRYGSLIELAHDNGLLTPEQWQTYARQAFEPSLIARPSARQGDPIPMNVRFSHPARLHKAMFLARYRWTKIRVDESLDVPSPKYNDNMGARISSNSSSYSNPTLGPDETMTAGLSVGTHRADAQMHLEIWDVPIATERHIGEFPEEPPIVETDRDATATFEILSKDAEVRFSVVDESLKSRMRESIQVKPIQQHSPGNYQLNFKLESPPMRLFGQLLVRTPDREVVFDGYVDIRAGDSTSYGYSRTVDLGDATSASVVFAPDPDRVRRSVDPSPTWGEEIIYENISIEKSQ